MTSNDENMHFSVCQLTIAYLYYLYDDVIISEYIPLIEVIQSTSIHFICLPLWDTFANFAGDLMQTFDFGSMGGNYYSCSLYKHSLKAKEVLLLTNCANKNISSTFLMVNYKYKYKYKSRHLSEKPLTMFPFFLLTNLDAYVLQAGPAGFLKSFF